MITIGVRDFRGCQRADIECAPIALVGGRNKAGKSSIAEGVACALTGNGIPFAGVTKSTVGQLVRTGAAGAVIDVAGEQGQVTMSWPQASARSEGTAPQASMFAAGMQSIVDMAPRERARALSDYLRALPTRDDLEAALTEHGWGPELVTAVWNLITEQGWDGAHASRRDKGAELKGRWRQITGMVYGSRVGASWRPDLTDLKETDLLAAVAQARTAVDNAVAAEAVSHVERQRLEGIAAELPTRTDTLRAADARVGECTEGLRLAQEARVALPPAEQPRTLPCPHCGGALVIRQTSLVETVLEKAATPPSEGDAKQRRLAIADAEGKLANATDKLNLARRAVSDAQRAIEESEAARQRIANWPQAFEAGTDTEAARADLARAEKRLTEYRAKLEADDIHQKIESNETLLALLAGDGLRARKLARVLDVFVNQQLKALTDAAGWPERITLDADMALYLDGRPFSLLSKSEKYRVRVVLQVAMAILDGSDLIVVDEADILDAPTRGGLFSMLDQASVPALVCMTLSRPDQLPDLAAAELGASYWLDAGASAPLRPAAAAA